MPIEINGQPQTQSTSIAAGQQVKVGRGDPTAAQEETGGSTASDTVSFSDEGATVAEAQQAVAELPVVDNQRVEDIRQAIANGTFEIDEQSVAQSLIDLESDLV